MKKFLKWAGLAGAALVIGAAGGAGGIVVIAWLEQD